MQPGGAGFHWRNGLPPFLRRAAGATQLRYRTLSHRGSVVRCPICGSGFTRFRDDGDRPNAICWRCGAHERHRALWLFLERHLELLGEASSLLHFAPEWCLEHRLRGRSGIRYLTADLEPGTAQLVLDITNLQLPDDTFDAILCSHVLEHVEDDRAAMCELHRVLCPGGWAIVMVPLDLGRTETYEDPEVLTAAQRERCFLKSDHVRLYAPDIADRLRAAGFHVEREQWAHQLGPEQAARYGLLKSDEIFLCRKA